MAEAYFDFFDQQGWGVNAHPSLEEAKFAETISIIDFRAAEAWPEAAMTAPLNKIAFDFHYDPAYAKEPLEYPFHVFDNATVIVHDHEARWFIKNIIRPVNARYVMFPYPSAVAPSAFVDGKPKMYGPKIFSDHPWLEGSAVFWLHGQWPKTVTQDSFLVIPAYHPTVWGAIRWAAETGIAIVAPGLESFSRSLMSSALLFDPTSHHDFKRKLLMLHRPAQKFPKKEKLKIGVVVPLYKKDAVGGAENHAGDLARAFLDAGHDATILATRTDSMLIWNNNLPDGVEEIDGLPVERFPIEKTDATYHHALSHDINVRGELSYHEYTEWMRTNIRSKALEKKISETKEFDAFFFIPYLYGTTFWGSQMAPEKSFLIPCYHDEPPAYTKVIRQNALWMAGLFLNTHAEARLASASLSIANSNISVVGEGIDVDISGNSARFRKKYAVTGDFVLYVGRLQKEKNVEELIAFHRAFVEKTGRSCGLVLAGQGDVKVTEEPGVKIKHIGFIPEQDKIDAYVACTAFCLPSTKESFSIVMMEAWAQGRPVIAHGDCNVSREHLFTCQGGLLYHGEKGYADALLKIIDDPVWAKNAGRKGRSYARKNFTWEKVIERLMAALVAIPPRSLAERLGAAAKEQAAGLAFGGLHGFSKWVENAPDRAANLNSGYDLPLPQLLDLADDSSDIRVEYEEFSHRPVIGTLFSKTRGAVTQHLRTNYLEPLEKNQSSFNRTIAEALRRFFEGK